MLFLNYRFRARGECDNYQLHVKQLRSGTEVHYLDVQEYEFWRWLKERNLMPSHGSFLASKEVIIF